MTIFTIKNLTSQLMVDISHLKSTLLITEMGAGLMSRVRGVFGDGVSGGALPILT